MDNLETLSDCSETSRNSECSSNVSSLSTLSEYQSEFLKLKRLINPESNLHESSRSNVASTNIASWYETQIAELNIRLQESLQTNERYRNSIHNLQKEKDILHSDKIEKLLKQNRILEANLSAVNNQIRRLIDICNKRDLTETSVLEERVLQLEKINHDLMNENYSLSDKVNHCLCQKDEVENEYKNLKSEYNDLKLELTVKISGTKELKKKISEQHQQLQEISQSNIQLSHSFQLISNELQCVKKSEKWYKNELRQFQQEKSSLCEKILENEKIVALQEEKIDDLNLELSNLKCSFEEMRLITLKEKERILNQFEFVNQQGTIQECTSVSSCVGTANIEGITKHYESVIKDLTHDVVKVKSDFEQRQKDLENVCKEKSNLLEKYITVQNYLKKKENIIEILEKTIKDLKIKLTLTLNAQENYSSEILGLKKERVKLKNELGLKNEEQEIFEKSINTVKEQLKIFMNKYVSLKNEMHEKKKELLNLQFEKQELWTNNNQRICEFKKKLEMHTSENEKLNRKITYLKTLQSNMECENLRLAKTIESLNSELVKVQSDGQTEFCSHHENSILEKENKTVNLQEPRPLDINVSLNDNGDTVTLNSSDVIDIFNYICKCFKVTDDGSITSSNLKTAANNRNRYVELLIEKINSHFQSIETEFTAKDNDVLELKSKLNILMKNILARMTKLMNRCKILETRNEENTKLLKLLCHSNQKDSFKDEVQYLETLVQVKTQEAEAKQRRYERNYRTLLRKVKEHMKGRNTAEKHNVCLQELYNTLSGDHNTLKLQMDFKNSEINDLQNSLQITRDINEKLKLTICKLENELSAVKPCTKCVDFEELKKREVVLEKCLKNHESCEIKLVDLKIKDELIESLQKENERLLLEISSKSAKCSENLIKIEDCFQDNKALNAKLAEFETQLAHEKILNAKASEEVMNIKHFSAEAQSENDVLKAKVDHITDQNLHLLQKIQHLNSCLQRKSEEVDEFQLRKEHATNRWLEKERNMQNLITGLKNQLHSFKSEIDIVKNEKFFLRRLCNDLKIALKTHVNNNKAFKEYFEKGDDNSIILSNFPSPIKHDDLFIDKLLQENQMIFQDKPFCDIQECLNTLKKEILFLQKQIAQKNIS